MPLNSVENCWQSGMEGKSGSASGSVMLKEVEVNLVAEARAGKLDRLCEYVERLKAAGPTVSAQDAEHYVQEWQPRLEMLERELKAAESCAVSSAGQVRLIYGVSPEKSFHEHENCLERGLLHRCGPSGRIGPFTKMAVTVLQIFVVSMLPCMVR